MANMDRDIPPLGLTQEPFRQNVHSNHASLGETHNDSDWSLSQQPFNPPLADFIQGSWEECVSALETVGQCPDLQLNKSTRANSKVSLSSPTYLRGHISNEHVNLWDGQQCNAGSRPVSSSFGEFDEYLNLPATASTATCPVSPSSPAANVRQSVGLKAHLKLPLSPSLLSGSPPENMRDVGGEVSTEVNNFQHALLSLNAEYFTALTDILNRASPEVVYLATHPLTGGCIVDTVEEIKALSIKLSTYFDNDAGKERITEAFSEKESCSGSADNTRDEAPNLPKPSIVLGSWSEEELRWLQTLVRRSTENTGNGVDWDWVVANFGPTRKRRQILLKATGLGLKLTSTVPSRLTKQKRFLKLEQERQHDLEEHVSVSAGRDGYGDRNM